MFRFVIYAVPLLLLELALFGFAVEILDVEPRSGSVIRLALLEQPAVPGKLVFGTWLVEISGLIALFLLAQGRFAAWWLDGLVAGWVAWVFRGPLLVITIVVAARQPQDPWWTLAFGWWVLYSVCGVSLAVLARRSGLAGWAKEPQEAKLDADDETDAVAEDEAVEPGASKTDENGPPVEGKPSEEASGEPRVEDSDEIVESEACAEALEDKGLEDDALEDSAVESSGHGADASADTVELKEPEEDPEEPRGESSADLAIAHGETRRE